MYMVTLIRGEQQAKVRLIISAPCLFRCLHLCKRIKGRIIPSCTEEKHLCDAPAPYVTYGTRDETLNMFREPLMDDDEQGD